MKIYESIDAHTISGFSSEQEATQFIVNTLRRWDYAIQSVNGNKIDLGMYDIGIKQTAENTYKLQVYTSRPPTSGGVLYDYYDTLIAKLAWQAGNKTVELDEYRYYDEPTDIMDEYIYDNWVPINTYNLDWFDTDAEYTEFLGNTLNRWDMPPIINGNEVICATEGFKLTVVPSHMSAMCSKNIHEVTLYSNGRHIISMLEEIMDCLGVQALTDRELTEDEAYELISVELKDMTEHQVQNHMRNSGQDPRDEINEWALEYTGMCDHVKRISFCKFASAVINVSIKNMNNIYGATFSDTMFSSASVLENVTFVHCTFDNVEFNGLLSDVRFDNCVMKSVSWPGKKCNIQIINTMEPANPMDMDNA